MSGATMRNAASWAAELGVCEDSLFRLGCTIDDRGNLRWPERDGEGVVIGWSTRFDDGSKRADAGGRRGLCYIAPLLPYAGTSRDEPIILVEGLSDTATGIDLGYDAIGRPSATGGNGLLGPLVSGRHVVIVGENDSGAGRTGAEKCAAALHGHARSVRIAFPPPAHKDLRAWVAAVGLETVRPQLATLIDDAPEWAPAPDPHNNGRGTSIKSGGERRRFVCSDLGNAERLVERHGTDLRYVRAVNRWLVWDGKRYRIDETGEVERMMGGVVRNIYCEAAAENDEHRRKELAGHARKSEARAKIEAALGLAWWQPGIAVVADDLDRDTKILNTPTGIVDLRTGELRSASRADLCTKLTAVGFDPEATCPTFNRFLHRIFGGKTGLIDYMQRLAGYCATGEVTEQILALAIGCGRNGKTTLFDILMRTLGDYASKAAPDLLTLRNKADHPTGTADLCGKRMVVISEVDDCVRWNESRMKELTGETRIKARVMRGDFFEFPATHKLIVFGNSKPEIRGTDLGTWRRLRLVPFEVVIPEGEVDPRLPEKLQAEAAGVLRWIVEGAVKWHTDGLKAPAEVTLATIQYRAESDMIGQFIEERCEEGVGLTATAADIRMAYEEWCGVNGEPPVTGKKLGAALKKRGFGKERDRGKPGSPTTWIGIGLRGSG